MTTTVHSLYFHNSGFNAILMIRGGMKMCKTPNTVACALTDVVLITGKVNIKNAFAFLV